jgi:hypothetical protein
VTWFGSAHIWPRDLERVSVQVAPRRRRLMDAVQLELELALNLAREDRVDTYAGFHDGTYPLDLSLRHHLGMRACQAHRLLEFLREYESEHLFLVGDIVDFRAMGRRGVYWTAAMNTGDHTYAFLVPNVKTLRL